MASWIFLPPVAATLILLASAVGLVDHARLWINPTFLAPQIAGGLIMGVGFIIGGFCPGTSLVAASTLKLDGVAFVAGVAAGIFAFGESVSLFDPFFRATSYGRLTIPDWLGVPPGIALVGLIVMALAMFAAAEISEAYFGRGERGAALGLLPRSPAKIGAAAALLAAAIATAIIGQPTPEDRWRSMGEAGEGAVASRAIYVDPAEVVDLKRDLSLLVNVLDVRGEADFNRFHLEDARRIDLDDARGPDLVRELAGAGENAITFLVSNDERDATEAYRILKAQNVHNIYVIEGGINNWLDRYPPPACVARRRAGKPAAGELAWIFAYSLGSGLAAAHPDVARADPAPACARADAGTAAGSEAGHGAGIAKATYTRKVKIQKKVAAKGGCG